MRKRKVTWCELAQEAGDRETEKCVLFLPRFPTETFQSQSALLFQVTNESIIRLDCAKDFPLLADEEQRAAFLHAAAAARRYPTVVQGR